MEKLTVTTTKKRQLIDITDLVMQRLNSSKNGIIHLFVAHTTCAVTTCDLDPGTDEDYLIFIDELTPKLDYQHPHNPEHAPDHIWSSIIGPELSVPIADGRLLLGTWQRITLIELDGPRERNVYIHYIK